MIHDWLHGGHLPWGEPPRLWQHMANPRPCFVYQGRVLPYFLHLYHSSYRNERAVEVSIMLDALIPGQRVLEVGNVLNHYVVFPHDVVDKYERAPHVANQDVVDFQPAGKRYDLIISVSTLEHVGWDEQPRDPGKILRAVEQIRHLLAPVGRALFTVPLGWNSYLDDVIRRLAVGENLLGVSRHQFMLRMGLTAWREATWSEVNNAKFGTPFWCANAIMIGEIRPLAPSDLHHEQT